LTAQISADSSFDLGIRGARLSLNPGARARPDRIARANERLTDGCQTEEDPMPDMISFKLNGRPVQLKIDASRPLLWVLRTDLALTGTKFGCGESYCGACTVLVNDRAMRSCSLTVNDVRGKDVTTIEGLASDGRLHPVQEAFMAHDALQCGYCTPGMILTAVSFLRENPSPTREQIIRAMDDNLCRCGAHTRIIDAIQEAAAKHGGQ
jgi:aerobic-type carbon monoxide dehydrogenase small subunit (CoxS/CutS family)